MTHDRINPDLTDEYGGEARKRLFIGLITATSLVLCLLLVILWIIPFVGLRTIHPLAPWIFGAIVGGAIGLVLWASLGLVINILSGKTLPLFKRMRGLTVKIFLPLMTLFGRLLGISKQRVRSSFIKVNNELVDLEHKRYRPEEILLLMPHCLQRSRCNVRLTYNIENCKRCGKCPIDGLLELSHKYGIHLAIATGGTIARRIVVQQRPSIILAVACERDLSSGIQDTYPLPVYGVLNDRPYGPCLDTQVPHDRLEAAIRRFLTESAIREVDSREASDHKGPQPADA